MENLLFLGVPILKHITVRKNSEKYPQNFVLFGTLLEPKNQVRKCDWLW